MALRDELEEDDTVDRDVTTGSCSNNGPEGAEGDKVLGTSDGEGEDSADEDSRVEGRLAADDISHGTPEESTDDQSDVVSDGTEADSGYIIELVHDGRTDGGDALRPEVVDHPAATVDDEEDPLKPVRSDCKYHH